MLIQDETASSPLQKISVDELCIDLDREVANLKSHEAWHSFQWNSRHLVSPRDLSRFGGNSK